MYTSHSKDNNLLLRAYTGHPIVESICLYCCTMTQLTLISLTEIAITENPLRYRRDLITVINPIYQTHAQLLA